MGDILLEKFFETWRWEEAIENGVIKGIDKGELRKLCSPEVRNLLLDRIITGKYDIAPPHQVRIPKDNGDYRIVYVNENIDRIFLSIVNNMLFELFPDMIHKSCKSYQKGIGCGKVVQEASRKICETSMETSGVLGFKADLSKYFDSVPLEYIMRVLDHIEGQIGFSSIISVLRRYYMSNICFNTEGNLIQHYQSLKQGCAVASFLADTMLYHIDEMLSSLPGFYVRYSDDILYIGTKTEKAMGILQRELNKMQMRLNPKKVEQLYADKWFKFLGFTIKSDQISLSKSRIKSFQDEISNRTIKKNISYKNAVHSVNHYLYIGNGEYSWATQVLPIINTQKDINTLNQYVMDCIRACITGKKKVGGLGCTVDKSDYTILRGTGKNVTENRRKTDKSISGYYSLGCMRNAMLTCKPVYETLVRSL